MHPVFWLFPTVAIVAVVTVVLVHSVQVKEREEEFWLPFREGVAAEDERR